MSPTLPSEPEPNTLRVTQLLEAASRGDQEAFDAAFAHVYADLRRLARAVRGGRAGETLSATALVHEAYFKAVSVPTVQRDWRSARAWLRAELADHHQAEGGSAI